MNLTFFLDNVLDMVLLNLVGPMISGTSLNRTERLSGISSRGWGETTEESWSARWHLTEYCLVYLYLADYCFVIGRA